MASLPMRALIQAMRQHGLVRFVEHFINEYPDTHLKDLIVDYLGPDRTMEVAGRRVINFGSDSFLGLDQDARVQQALVKGVQYWGSHNGASRAFASVRANERAEAKLAAWLGTEDVLIYPSVSLANLGALPGLVGRRDLLAIDAHAHNSMQEGAKIAQANGTRVVSFDHAEAGALAALFQSAPSYRCAVVAIDGVYSMTGAVAPLAELNDVCKQHGAVLYVDDAHGSAVLGRKGRGTVLDALGSYDNVLAVGSLSKGFSCFGGYVGCPAELKRLLKMRSSTFIFGGPVPPPYLEAICVVCDILASPEYEVLRERLQANTSRLTQGARDLGLVVLGGDGPIVSILVGDEDITLGAGRALFDRGYYVQSVTFPAVPYHAGVLRIQVNANHAPAAINGLLAALAEVQGKFALPQAAPARRAA
jgi:7-keto-8-aminopelargonate synthetase-like enzyme